jgi:transposase-like protein
VASGRPIKQVAETFGISDQTIYNWRRQHLIDTGQAPGGSPARTRNNKRFTRMIGIRLGSRAPGRDRR